MSRKKRKEMRKMKIENKELNLVYEGSLRKIFDSVVLEAGLCRISLKEAHDEEKGKIRKLGLAIGALSNILSDAIQCEYITESVEERMKNCGWIMSVGDKDG